MNRIWSIFTGGRRDAEAGIDELVRRLRHPRAAVRARAATQLGHNGMRGASPELVRAARDRRRSVRRAALGALWRVDPNQFADTAVELAQGHAKNELFADLDAILDTAARIVRRPGTR